MKMYYKMKNEVLLVLILLCGVINNAGAQSCPATTDLSFTDIWAGYPSTDFWQSFVPAVPGITTGIEVFVNGCTDETVTLTIYSGTGTGGTVIYSAPVSVNGCNSFTTLEIPYLAGVTLNTGSTYTFEVQTAEGIQLIANNSIGYGNFYVNGQI
jgi:hypothetical protein